MPLEILDTCIHMAHVAFKLARRVPTEAALTVCAVPAKVSSFNHYRRDERADRDFRRLSAYQATKL
jgi:hypothetical protein